MAAPAANWVPDRGDVIWIDFNPQTGIEMRDEHPMLVLSTLAFNRRTSLVIGLPMTHSDRNEDNPFAIKYAGPGGHVGYVLAHQPKSFDWRRRNARPHQWGNVGKSPAFAAACETLNEIIGLA